MGCCREFAKRFVIGISVIDIIVSIAIIGVSSFLINELGAELDELSLNAPPVGSLVLGVFMFLFGFLGCCGAWKNIKIMLIVYSIGTFIFTLIIIAFGIVVLVQSGELDNVARAQEPASNVETNVQTFILATFSVCCDPANDNLIVACADATINNVQPCVLADNQDLFEDFVAFLDDGDNNAGTCQLLQEVEADGKPLINGDDIGTGDICEDGREEFVAEATGFIEENFVKIGIANLVTGVILMLLLIFSCVLIFTNEEEFKEGEKQY